MQAIGYTFIAIGLLLLGAGVYYMKKQNIVVEIKEYRALMEATNDEYEPPKPIERMYEKKPINSFIGSKEAIIPEEELPEMDLSGDDELVFGDDTSEFLPADEEETSILDEETSFLDDEGTTFLDEELTSVLEEDTTLLDEEFDEETSLLEEFDDLFDEEEGIL